MQLLERKDKTSSLQVWPIVFGLLGYELISFLPAWFGLDSRIVTVPYRSFFLLLCIFVTLKLLPKHSGRLSFFMGTVLLFWTAYLARLFYDSFFTAYRFSRPVEEYWLYAFCLGFIPIFAYMIPLKRKTVQLAMVYSFYCAALVNVIALYSNISTAAITSVSSRMVGNEFLNPITYGQLGTMLVLLAICLLINGAGRKNKFHFILLYLMIMIGLANVSLSGSRGPFIQLIIASLLLAYFKLKRRYWGYVVVTVALLLVAGAFVSASFPVFDVLIERITSTGDTGNVNDNLRIQVMTNAWNGFLDAPVFGTSFEERKLGMYPHNYLVEACMTTGIFGGLMMLGIFIYSFVGSVRLLKDNTTCWIGLLCIISLISGLTTGSLWGAFKFWALITLVDNLLNSRERVVAKPVTVRQHSMIEQ
jgi:hypothetical protein